ncbi:MAG: hypothetical protein WKF81_11715 [Thermomicrobiales bacterium]
MSVTTISEARELRPSQVIAEALVDRQAPKQLEARAKELGYCSSLTTAVVHACCGSLPHHLSHVARTQSVSDQHSAG